MIMETFFERPNLKKTLKSLKKEYGTTPDYPNIFWNCVEMAVLGALSNKRPELNAYDREIFECSLEGYKTKIANYKIDLITEMIASEQGVKISRKITYFENLKVF